MRRQGPLTPRECEILELLAEFHGYQYISNKLGISLKTTYDHVFGIMSKIGKHKKEEVIKYALDHYGRNGAPA
jgi:DNA-binding NarL/FixJ family response regulator